jgi:hypothetical protein
MSNKFPRIGSFFGPGGVGKDAAFFFRSPHKAIATASPVATTSKECIFLCAIGKRGREEPKKSSVGTCDRECVSQALSHVVVES